MNCRFFLLEGAPKLDSEADKEKEERNYGIGGEYVGQGLNSSAAKDQVLAENKRKK